jgi:hypothetical protein
MYGAEKAYDFAADVGDKLYRTADVLFLNPIQKGSALVNEVLDSTEGLQTLGTGWNNVLTRKDIPGGLVDIAKGSWKTMSGGFDIGN